MGFKILFLLLVFLFLFQSVNSWNIKNATITQKSTNILGVDVDYAMFDIDFDRDLYLYRTASCSNFTCPPKPAIDCTCDYTNPDPLLCGQPFSKDPSCPPCPKSYFIEGPNIEYFYCDSSHVWTTLKANETLSFEKVNSTVYFRYKAENSYCEGIKLYVTQDRGSIILKQEYFGGWKKTIGEDGEDYPLEISSCPDYNQPFSFVDFWTNDTFFFQVVPFSDSVSFTIEIISYPIPELDLSQPKCTDLYPGVKCINDGESVVGNSSGIYTFSVDHNMTLTIQCPQLQEDIDFYIDDKIIDIDKSTPKWVNQLYGDDYLTITVGPNADGSPKILYIMIVTFVKSNFSCSFSSYGPKWMYPISSGPTRGTTFQLIQSSRLHTDYRGILPTKLWYQSSLFFAVKPRENNNPLWPTPSYMFQSNFYSYGMLRDIYVNETFSNPGKSSAYQAGALMSYKYDSDFQFATLQQILNSKLEFLNTIVDVDGYPLEGFVDKFHLNIPECNYNEYLDVSESIKDTLSKIYETNDYMELALHRYYIDIYTISNGWLGCQTQANSFLQLKDKSKTVLSESCPYLPTDPRYSVDPCCEPSLLSTQCCIPKVRSIQTQYMFGVNDDLVSSQCSSLQCTTSLLYDYYDTVSLIKNDDDCSINQEDFPEYQTESPLIIRRCKSVYDTAYCKNNSDCGGYNCNLYSRTCEVPLSVQDKEYLKCVLNQLKYSALNYIQVEYLPNSNVNDTDFYDQVYNHFQIKDCSSLTGGNRFRRYFTYHKFYMSLPCYPSPHCYDDTCVAISDTCFQQDSRSFEKVFNEIDKSTCETDFNICQGCSEDNSTCISQCDSQYCGYCSSNFTNCFTIPTATTKDTCENTNICLLSNGEVKYGLTQEQCETDGICSDNCGYQCSGFQGCIDLSGNDQSSCSYDWDPMYQICFATNLSQPQCIGSQYQWENCSLKSNDECLSVPNYGLCRAIPIQCKNVDECEQFGGTCSDQFYFNQENVPTYPTQFGKCLLPFRKESGRAVLKCEFTQHTSPFGCFSESPTFLTKEQCEQAGNLWWSPSNHTTCELVHGCQIPDISIEVLQYQFRFNQMNESECERCDDTQHKWTNVFNFKKAKWLPGVYLNPTWMNQSRVNEASYTSTLDLESFSKAVIDSVYARFADLLRSSSICRVERLLENLGSIACSCSGPGGSQCFTTSSIALGTTTACVQESSNFEFTYGQISFYPDSVEYSCVNVLVSQFSRQLFKANQKESLSSDFISYPKPNDFSLVNEKDAIIGIITGDGIRVSNKGIQYMEVCLATDSGTSSTFGVYDIALESGDILVPMNLNITIRVDRDLSFICSNISVSSSSDSQSYFPIIRKDNWKNEVKQTFNKSATGLLYTLAVLFGMNAIWGISQMISSSYRAIVGAEKFKLVQLLILNITVFMLIRSIYFFILPSGKFTESTIADYIMVVLPTFIYFTAFSIIIILWYIFVVNMKSQQRSFASAFSKLIAIVNIVFYILFIMIVLVFNFSKMSYNNDCGSRMTVSIKATSPQRAVSIFYSVIQAVISLLIGAAFIYLGGSIMKMLDIIKGHTSTANQQQRKIFIVTYVCSIGFLLHCVFVLIIVGARPTNIIFSFIGLIITEIIPAMSILYAYNQNTFCFETYHSNNTSSTSRSSTSLKKLNASSPNNSG